MPNTFTPNGDGLNDEFSINLNGTVLNSFEIQIYNRWGVLMFSSQNINVSWDGRTSAGVKATEGTYFYIAKINDMEYIGNLALFR